MSAESGPRFASSADFTRPQVFPPSTRQREHGAAVVVSLPWTKTHSGTFALTREDGRKLRDDLAAWLEDEIYCSPCRRPVTLTELVEHDGHPTEKIGDQS